ncbi:dihydrolipoyl transacylase [Cavenderia fasciculata]|uniref:Dihydrolipoamide acetyltransferase component of pyruvate dehydrogenase complex n=1 Tax=Cavenderia fasciculata TaxID=261658 RepID=F4PZU4_CACFS|nr:dihydrolipoyl transacylase [Cavenderia fasciculata]EGG18858.1 dihydrolipoyl transacylase [Cavenderia fasciculata]|eukprot:XP_004357320.1 dihydrolipoyl transacylase [Cavenderia fasciculata]
MSMSSLPKQLINNSSKHAKTLFKNKRSGVVASTTTTRSFTTSSSSAFTYVANNNTTTTTTGLMTSNTSLFNSSLVSINTVKKNYSSSTGGKVIQFNLADIGEGIAECEVLKWHYKVGDSIKEFDQLCEVQSDKATVEITSRYDGVITKLYYKVGEMAKVGTPLIDIRVEGEEESAAPTAAAAAPSKSTTSTTTSQSSTINNHHENDKVLATPAVRNLAKVNNINLKNVQGNGRDGRVLKEDIVSFIQNGGQSAQVAAAPAAPVVSAAAPIIAAAAPTGSKPETRVPITGIKKVMVKTMNAAALVPHFGYCEEYIMDGLMLLRAQLKPIAEQRNIKLSYLPFLIKATSLALNKFPVLNASMSPSETEVIIKHYHNIGVAMDTPQGLLVPNIKNVESKSIFEIAQELNRLQKDGLAGKLTPADMSGGTFSLSNIGTIGGTYASPVLLLPEVAIGAIGKIQKLPRFDRQGQVVPVNIMQISWSADHRVIDGATMANFSNLLKSYIETPNTMILDTK